MSNRAAIITGASRGIGLAIARRFADRGFKTLLVARNAGELEQAAASLKSTDCATQVADVGAKDGVELVLDAARQRLGRVDVLVNNAGVAPMNSIEKITDEDFRQMIAVNVEAVFRLTRGVWAMMRQQGGGTIVNVSSAGSIDPFPGFSVYGATKAWVNLFTRAMAAEGKEFGIRVFAVAPGAVETQLLRSRFPDFPEQQALSPDDVAAVVEAACEPALQYSSGETIFLRK